MVISQQCWPTALLSLEQLHRPATRLHVLLNQCFRSMHSLVMTVVMTRILGLQTALRRLTSVPHASRPKIRALLARTLLENGKITATAGNNATQLERPIEALKWNAHQHKNNRRRYGAVQKIWSKFSALYWPKQTISKMIWFRIFVALLLYLHGYFASPTFCDVILASKIIVVPTNSTYCSDFSTQLASLCDDQHFVSNLYSCNVHGELQKIDFSGFGFFGNSNHDKLDMTTLI